jgi:hypothetical protein
MKTKLTLTLTVLALVAVALFSASIATISRGQTLRPAQPRAPEITTPGQEAALKLSSASATCFCKVTANGTEVAKPSKGGYVQPFQAEACRNYCRGLWDSGQAQRVAWAKLLPNACGNVTVRLEAALGTMGYQLVRGPETETGINGTHFVTTCTCPSGQTASNTIGGKKYCLIPPSLANVPSVPDQVNGTYVWSGGNFYLSSGAQTCVTACQ